MPGILACSPDRQRQLYRVTRMQPLLFTRFTFGAYFVFYQSGKAHDLTHAFC